MSNPLNIIRRLSAAIALAALAFFTISIASRAFADEAKKVDRKTDDFKSIRALEGTWVGLNAPQGEKPMTLVFRPTAAGSAVMETMGPGSDHEMLNVYTNTENGVF